MRADGDFLREDFERLEREVLQRHCDHPNVIDDTMFGDRFRYATCLTCGKRHRIGRLDEL